MRHRLLSVMMAAALACAGGCWTPVGSPLRLASNETIQASPDRLLAEAYGTGRIALVGNDSKAIRAEIDRRKLFTADEWIRVDNRALKAGDGELVVLAALGPPHTYRAVSGGSGWVYEGLAGIPDQTVVIANGRVAQIER